jgi:hypothetical protein
VLLLEKAFAQISHLYFFNGGGLDGSRGRLVIDGNPIMLGGKILECEALGY